MCILSQVARKMQEVLTDIVYEAGVKSGFIQREGKISICVFIKTLVMCLLTNPEASYTDMAQAARTFEVDVTRQAFANRMTLEAAETIKTTLEVAATQVLAAPPQNLPILSQFKGVYVQDSTWISLPDELSSVWKGTGCRTKDKKAAIKLQLRFDVLTGAIEHFQLTDGITTDRKAEQDYKPLPAGSLRLADLGYFSLDEFEKLTQTGVFWISRLKVNCKLFDEHKAAFCLDKYLSSTSENIIDHNCFVGAKKHLPARLIALRCSKQEASKRRKRIRSDAKRRGTPPSKEKLRLADWNIYITNTDTTQLTPIQVATVFRVRWQVELLFKSFKSIGKVNSTRRSNPIRILCEVYAKLLTQLIRHWIMVASGWKCIKHDTIRTAVLIAQHARTLMISFHKSKTAFLSTLRNIKQDLLNSDCGEHRVGKRTTYKLLEAAKNP